MLKNKYIHNNKIIPHLPHGDRNSWVSISLVYSELDCNCLIFSQNRNNNPLLYHHRLSYIIMGFCFTYALLEKKMFYLLGEFCFTFLQMKDYEKVAINSLCV